MSQRDNFSGGFLLGTIVGGIVGGIAGALLASRKLDELESESDPRLSPEQTDLKGGKAKKHSLKSANGHSDIEAARRSLEDKIAQLNDAIDDVRQQLSGVESTSPEEGQRSLAREP